MIYTSVMLKTGRSDIAPQMLVTLKEKEKQFRFSSVIYNPESINT